eukprot:CAMPEP_0201284092 /NCGR_PEP_ID=MMETSP1317-20130820/61396_1 /ASSEMBLY_ACC=CAM_ASM_000770 /TAXON_ID=187299 /ORGANISM="Undescribed Undescribed, Strain Undescribed" /LENGTH=159 /DNA_ID=CAMNT_0047602743 /DNA_START=609 /DNA_END=1085 /DNA_ORIENTATION=-
MERLIDEIRRQLKSERVRIVEIKAVDKTKISIKVRDTDTLKRLENLLDKDYKNLRVFDKLSDDVFTTIHMDLPSKEIAHIKQMAVEQALETIRNRIDQFGVSEPDIRIQGEKRILVQLPGIKDINRAKELIGKTALLEFKLVDETNNINSALNSTIPSW